MGLAGSRALTMRTGLANVIAHVDRVLAMMAAGLLDPAPLVTHHMSLERRRRGVRAVRPARGAEDRAAAVDRRLSESGAAMTTAADTTAALPDALGAAARDFSQPTALLIGAERLEAADGRTFATLDPPPDARSPRSRHGRRRGCRRAPSAPRARRSRTGRGRRCPRPGASALMLALAGRDRGARRGARPDRVARQRQAGQARPVSSTCAGTVAHLRYFAGWPTKIEGGVLPVSAPEHALLHAPRAGRRVRADHPVELPAADGRLEARPGARRRLHDRAEAGRADAAERAAPRRARARGRASRRACSTCSPATARPARRSSITRASTRSPSPARPRSGARSAPRPGARSSA